MHFIIFLIFSIPLFASDIQKVSNLTLEQSLIIMNQDGAQIRILELEEQMASLDIKKIEAKSLGSLDLSLSSINSNDAGVVFGTKLHARDASFKDFGLEESGSGLDTKPQALNHPESATYYEHKLNYILPIFTGFKLEAIEDIMRSLKKLKTLSIKKQKVALTYEIKNSFYTIELLQKQKSYFYSMLKDLKEVEETANAFVEEGFLKPLDSEEMQTNVYTIEEQIAQLNLNETIILEYLSFLIHRNIVSIKTDNLPEFKTFKVQNDIKNSITLKTMDVAKEIATKNLLHANAGYYPKLFIAGEIGSSSDRLLKDISNNSYYNVIVGVKWNLFNGFETSYDTEEARLNKIKVKSSKDLIERKLQLRLTTLNHQSKSTQHRINIVKKKLNLQEKIYENYQEYYFERLLSINVLLEQNMKIIENKIEVATLNKKQIELHLSIEKLISEGF